MNPLQVIAADHRQIIYRPELRAATGSVTASILLQQVIHWYYSNGQKPFYKFTAPCKHKAYKPNDSWTEELGFSKAELSKAREKIAAKCSKGKAKDMNALVWFWTDIQRLTWYDLNIPALEDALHLIYVNQQSAFTVNQQSAFTKTKKVYLDNTEKTNKEDYKEEIQTDADASAHEKSFSKSSLSSTLAHNTSKLTDSEKKKVAAKKKSELEKFYAEHDCTELPKFRTQPTNRWWFAKQREIGQDRMQAVLLEIERYCYEDNPDYTSQRKSLSGCFASFQKKTEPKLTIEAKQVWNDVFQDLFGEPMTFTNSESKKMGQLAELVRAGADKFAQRNYERKATDTEILDGLRKFLQRLPARFTKDATAMNIHFIVAGFQKIRLDIAGAKKASLKKGEYRNSDAVQAANNAKAIIF